MHVLMIGTDTSLLTGTIDNSLVRHEDYALRANGRISVVLCNRRQADRPLTPYRSERLSVQPTESRGYINYISDGVRLGMARHAEQPIDLITSQDPFLTALIGLRLRAKTRRPLIVQDFSCFVSSPYFLRERPRNRLLRLMARFTLPRADAVRVLNKRERLACIRLGVKPSRVCVSPLVTYIHPFAAPPNPERMAAWRQQLDLPEGTPVVLWVGRPVPFKNLPVLLQAFKRIYSAMPQARLVIGGDMSGTNIVGQAAAYGLGEVTRFPGAIKYDDLPPLYQLASVYALSSNYEGLGRVLLEAAAARLPIVSTANEGAADIIAHGITGYLTPIGDPEKLAEAILAVLQHPVRARQMAERAYEYVMNNFAPEKLTERWIGMWRRVVQGLTPCE
ncbi:MAG: glycosyltransferase family 4 protein [Anaerolineae bacterium]|nr:glycosyltransferase family 4 protein [Anaerolineae bacterium]